VQTLSAWARTAFAHPTSILKFFGEQQMPVRVIALIIAGTFSSVTFAESIPSIPEPGYKIVDDFSYTQQTAASVFKPMTGSKPVSVVDVDGRKALRMQCNFRGTKIDRASWDGSLKLDLTMCKGLQFLFYCPDPSPVASFVVYLHSGDGWYRGGFDAPACDEWAEIRVDKNTTSIEGRPAGWSKIDTIRVSAWRGQDIDTEFYIAALGVFGIAGQIVIVRGDSVANEAPSELDAVRQYTRVMSDFFDRAGLSHTILSDYDVTSDRLKGMKLLVLPHNPNMPDNVVERIAEFIRAGGKLIACYTLPSRLESTTGIRVGPHIRQRFRGNFVSIRPSAEPLNAMPAITRQASWNIREASAVEGRSRIAAWWYNDKDRSTSKPAIVASPNCIFLTHVLLADDSANKMQLLLAMAGELVPEFWRQAAEGCIDRVGRLGPYDNYNSAKEGIIKLALGNRRTLEALKKATQLHTQSLAVLSEGKFPQVITAAEQSRESLIDAYCTAQKSLRGEHRAFWCHSAFGVANMTWDRAIKILADNGFTAVLPNMLWAGAAFYKSDVLPVAAAVEQQGDQIELCLAACKKYGVECHVWKVNYNMGWATDKKFIAAMKADGRTQVNYDGSSNDRWLCPSNPANQKLEIESMLEVARKYDVHGLHFDYIRYPGDEDCFCKGCRERFEKMIDKKIINWPADVRNEESLQEQWQDFRRRQITEVVAAVSGGAKKIRPDIKISAAVFRNWPVDRNSVGQDWKLWCDRGYLDFVCPMDYTDSSSHFNRMVAQQLTWVGKVPCFPGIGLSTWSDPSDICKLIEQINVTRKLGTGGFTIFNYSTNEANKILPLLGKGLTRNE
jgi:uncharacterized lipoprotein YddW (UPF0748 family)